MESDDDIFGDLEFADGPVKKSGAKKKPAKKGASSAKK